MPSLDGAVGKGGQNQRHDVAVVQAALSKLTRPDRKPFWPGPIDGDYPRHRRNLERVIGIFQQCHRLRASGKLNRLGSDVNRIENALPASHRRMSGVPGTTLVRRRNTAAPAPAAEAAARTEATAPLPDLERAALAALQRDLFEAHKLCFTVSGIGVVSGGRFQVSLACPDSEWLDPRRNVFELGGRLPPALRKGLEGTLRGAARAWKIAPSSGDRPGLVLASARAFSALQPGAAPKREALEAFAIAQAPSEPTARACLAACLDLAANGETQTPAGRKQFEDLAEAVGVMHQQTAKALATGLQTAERDPGEGPQRPRESDCLKGDCRKLTAGEIALAMTVFGTNIPYESVEVHNHGYPLLFGFQDSDTLVAPNGNIYADKDGNVYSDDYSTTGFWLQAAFIHEMAHVWQKRVKGINVAARGVVERQYAYTIVPGKRFLDYKLEQQAALVGDYFRFLHGQRPRYGQPLKDGKPLEGNAALAVYRRLLPFVLNEIST